MILSEEDKRIVEPFFKLFKDSDVEIQKLECSCCNYLLAFENGKAINFYIILDNMCKKMECGKMYKLKDLLGENSEYHEHKHFTEDEKEFIRLSNKIEYIARDKSGTLMYWTSKYNCIKKINDCYWEDIDGSGKPLKWITNKLKFKAIKWEDEKPTSREEILEG